MTKRRSGSATTTVVVDGSNIATEGRSAPSLAQLDEAVRAFLAEHPADTVVVVVDATFGHRIAAGELPTFEEAILAGELVTPPAGAIGRGDAFVLQIADKAGATVFSNDSFQEFHGTYEWLFDEGRLIGGKPVPPIGWVFVARSPVRGPTSRRAVRDAQKQRSTSTGAATGATRPAKRPTKKAAAVPAATTPHPNEAEVDASPTKARAPKKAGPKPLNEPLVFLAFVTEHPLGAVIDGEVMTFASHGAYVRAFDARCYVPLKSMGDPAPRSPREVLSIGEHRRFVVRRFDTARRGIDLSLERDDQHAVDVTELAADEERVATSSSSRRRASRARRHSALR